MILNTFIKTTYNCITVRIINYYEWKNNVTFYLLKIIESLKNHFLPKFTVIHTFMQCFYKKIMGNTFKKNKTIKYEIIKYLIC